MKAKLVLSTDADTRGQSFDGWFVEYRTGGRDFRHWIGPAIRPRERAIEDAELAMGRQGWHSTWEWNADGTASGTLEM
jgi:hypothetical protein